MTIQPPTLAANSPARLGRIDIAAPFVLAALAGTAWLAGGRSLLGPLAALLLPLAAALSVSRRHAFAAALLYYLIGSVSIPGAIAGYWSPHGLDTRTLVLGAAAWIGASALLALPWTLGRTWHGRLCALVLTALPPLGVISWLSPLNAAGVLFPAQEVVFAWLGIASTVALITLIRTPPVVFAFGVIALALNLAAPQATSRPAPAGWLAVNTAVLPGSGDIARTIAGQESVIDAAIAASPNFGHGAARVLVLPEAVLDNWLPGTRNQFAQAIPPGQTWLIGAQADRHNVVVAAQAGQTGLPMTRAAGLLLGGNWLPWDARTLAPAWWQPVFELDGERVWAALCVEQLQPWTWLEAMAQTPSVILAMSNNWWAPQGSLALPIEAATTRAWARLLDVPIIWARNEPQPHGLRP